jgi:hypothetical protein
MVSVAVAKSVHKKLIPSIREIFLSARISEDIPTAAL